VERAELARLARRIGEYQERVLPLFGRPETQGWAREYLAGLMMDVERKNCWQIAEARKIPPRRLKSLQHFLYGSRWNWRPVIEQMARMVDEHLGADDGIMVVDESGVRRWGEKSAGIGRQYIGNVGKTDNGQVGVYLTYASARGHAFLDTRLYILQEWFDDRKRCREAGIPDDVVFRTKPELAGSMVETAVRLGIRAQWLTADEAYGHNPPFLDLVDALGLWYVVEVPVDEEVWEERPKIISTVRRGKGRVRVKPRVSPDSPPSVKVADLVAGIPRRKWERLAVAEGTKGIRAYEFGFRRVVEKRNRLPGDDIWLMVRRSLDQAPETKYFLANAPSKAEQLRMAVVGSERWRVESTIKEAKGQTGLDESEGRNWNHWHHHTTLAMLAHAFLAFARSATEEVRFPPVGSANQKAHRPLKEGAAA
jgi:SRSO17 transposase